MGHGLWRQTGNDRWTLYIVFAGRGKSCAPLCGSAAPACERDSRGACRLRGRRTARGAQPARETSGHTAGLFHPLITKQEGVKSRLTRAGFLYALRNWQALASRTSCASPLQAFSERANGLLHLRESEDNDLAHVSVDLPKDYVRCVSRAEAKTLAGVRPASGGF